MQNCLLFIDMLGVKARWVDNGREGAEAAFTRFGDLVAVTVSAIPQTKLVSAFVESDACCIEVTDIDCALKAAEQIYRSAFEKDYEDAARRVWLRGVIVESHGGDHRTKIAPLVHQPAFVRHGYSSALLDAVNIEKSGFRGMRLLVARKLITDEVRNRQVVYSDGLYLGKLLHLKHSVYPKRTEEYDDYIWFAPSSKAQWSTYEATMGTRLRLAAKQNEEFLQAASTQLLFTEVRAILGDQQAKKGTYKRNKG